MVCATVRHNFAPAIFDYRARLDIRQSERFGLELQAAQLHDCALKDIILIQLDYVAVGFYNARRNVLNLIMAQIRQINFTLRLASTLVEYLYANVIFQRKLVGLAIVNANFPEDSFGVRVLFDDGSFQRQISRVNRLPVLSQRRGCRKSNEAEQNEGEKYE